jgi:hypothetical protein
VPARLCPNLRERFQFCAVLFHVTQSGSAEVTQRQRNIFCVNEAVGRFVKIFERARPISEYRTQRALAHLFEAKHQDTVRRAERDRLPAEKQGGGSDRTVVVDVDDGNTVRPSG